MLLKIGVILIGATSFYLTQFFNSYPVAISLLILELFNTKNKSTSTNLLFFAATLSVEIYFLYSGEGFKEIIYLFYIFVYIFITYKGKRWFFNNIASGFPFLLFAASTPIFLDFITRLLDVKLDLLLYLILFLLFLRLSDYLIESKVVLVSFLIIQVVSAIALEHFILNDNNTYYFLFFISIWTLLKWTAIGGKK